MGKTPNGDGLVLININAGMKSQQKPLYIFTDSFPYGNLETYLETELEYLPKEYKTTIVALGVRDSRVHRDISESINLIPVSRMKMAELFWYLLISLFDRNLYLEFLDIIKKRLFSLRTVAGILLFFAKAHKAYRTCIRICSFANNEEILFYVYRFEYQIYTAILIQEYLEKHRNKRIRIICRAHGYDLFEEYNWAHHIPLREFCFQHIDKVYSCSVYGRYYLMNRYPKFREKIETSYLGTRDCGLSKYADDRLYRIITCSNVVKVKRIDRIIRVLSTITDLEIEWVHYGDGSLNRKIFRMASKFLPANIRYVFKGRLSNKQVLNEMKNTKYDVFLNLSDSEGIPVSIMEATSLGIPCVATSVGGTPEIVEDQISGWLVSKDDDPEKIGMVIRKVLLLPEIEKKQIRETSRKKWEALFMASKNYPAFFSRMQESENNL